MGKGTEFALGRPQSEVCPDNSLPYVDLSRKFALLKVCLRKTLIEGLQ